MTRRNATQKRRRSLVRLQSARRGRYPFDRRYAALQGDDEHPVDHVIGRIREIAVVDRKVRRQSSRWEKHVDDPARYRDYEDLRLHQRCLREEAFFDAGHERGRVVGRAEAFAASIRRRADLNAVRGVLRVLVPLRRPPIHDAALLIAIAHALLVDPRTAMRGAR